MNKQKQEKPVVKEEKKQPAPVQEKPKPVNRMLTYSANQFFRG